MSPGHEQQIELLFGLAALLLTVIFGAIFFSFWKRIRSEQKAQTNKELTHEVKREMPTMAVEEPVIAHIDSSGHVVSDLPSVDLADALRKTEENLFGRIRSLFKSGDSNQHLDDIEEILYTSDLGPITVQRLMAALQDKLSRKERADYDTVRDALKEEIKNIFAGSHSSAPTSGILSKINFATTGPTVLMIVGVNGAGKTTSIGKISAQLAAEGKKVLVAAGDTFRAAAGGQLKVWTDRAQVEIFSPEGVTDPSAVAFDAVAKGKAQNYDIVIVDTAGRLHTQANLMEEIKKMKRVMTKVIPEAPHETLIVLDANSGQNALMQAKEFHNALELTGAVLTKMDGTAKGGVAVGLAQELQIPIKLIGVGERIQDLRTFSAQEFVDSLFQSHV
ncbi:signal recognition particle-docking protein FtsY [Bdellovibrio sp. SKB1291214]|uniref:signal recognition particle-docking protein FtsY n=1 Tax=Bdellovibrio sp. SKB1291214 TaxID=1732569 RepID=UPI000B5199CB|nr:signal recognition particle-docking protein FtsY [Bdellovibrio sp. SKB1291214]UYL09658.1 signal recognition particle-docking protein FtsY [Bdellovibrio sp. SKB1291214]